MRIIKWTLSGVGVLFGCLLIFLFISFRSMGQSDDGTVKTLKDAGLDPVFETVLYDSQKVQVIRIGDLTKPKILFVHGSPGDWTAFENIYLDKSISDNYCMIAYDRPGYGGTELPSEPILRIQASVAKTIMDTYANDEKFIVVCHSYGGGVVSQLLVDYPDMLEKAVLAAPALSPDQQEPRWYNKMAKWRIINWFIGDQMRASNIEMLGLAPSLREITDQLSDIQTPTVFIHGERDWLVPYETVSYWQKHVDDQNVDYVLRKKMGHLIPFNFPELIVDGIKD